jgi:signal peptidase I
MKETLISQTLQDDSSQKEHDAEMRSAVFLVYVAEFVKIFIIAAAIILPIRLFLIQPYYVKGSSMEPNFFENEYLIIDKMSVNFEKLKRGEVIVFKFPKSEQKFLIKRVIGLPGEKVEACGNIVRIWNTDYPDGITLNENPYHPRQFAGQMFQRCITEEVGQHEYFVLGDNRPASYDSSIFGTIPDDHITGRVIFRGLPVDRVSVFGTPQYNLK